MSSPRESIHRELRTLASTFFTPPLSLDVFSTEVLDTVSWMSRLQELETNSSIAISDPLLLIVESDGEDDSPWAGNLSYDVQTLTTRIYLVLGGNSSLNSQATSRTGNQYFMDVTGAYVGQTVTWAGNQSVVTAVGASSITVAAGGGEGVGEFPIRFSNNKKLAVEFFLNGFRESLGFDFCGNDFALHDSRAINVGTSLDLNRMMTGNRSNLWAGCLTLKWSLFYV